MYYILHGDEEFSRTEQVANLKQQIMGDGMGDLNISVLDGRKVTLDELINACNTLPFLTDRRMVIVEDLLQRLAGQGRSSRSEEENALAEEEADEPPAKSEDMQKLLDYLPQLPPSTRLLFVETRPLGRNHAVLKAAAKSKDAYVREYSTKDVNLRDWVRARAQSRNIRINRDAADLLIALVGTVTVKKNGREERIPNLRGLDSELEKLAAFVNYARPITTEDVQAMVSASHEETIFALVDTLGQRQGRQAMRSLQDLLAGGANELFILTMIARQFRLILSAKDLADRGASEAQLCQKLHVQPFVARKLLSQARHFQMDELEAIHRRVLEMDWAIKTGRIKPRLALELLVIETCRRPQKA